MRGRDAWGVTRRRTAVIGTMLASLSVVTTAAGVAAPALLSGNTVVLALLTPRAAYVAAAAMHLPVWLFLLAFVARLSIGDPLYFVLGRAHGGPGLRWLADRSPGCAGGLQRAERLVRRLGLPVTALVPTGPMMAAAGTVGLSFAASMSLNVMGTTGRVLALWAAGRAAPEVVLAVGDAAAVVFPAVAAIVACDTLRRLVRRRSVHAARRRHPALLAAPRRPSASGPKALRLVGS